MEKLLDGLWTCLPSREDEAMTMIHRMIELLNSGLSSEERDVCLNLVFQEERGIQAFVSSASNGSMKKIPPLVLEFLSFLLQWFPRCLEDYIITIKNLALSFIRKGSSSADEKSKAVDVLIGLIQTGPWSADLDLPSIVAQLCKMTSHKVSRPTVLHKVYHLVGVIAEKLPHVVNPKADRLLTALLADLEYQTTSSANVQFPIIEGCFEGLSGYLVTFPLSGVHQNDRSGRIACCIEKVIRNHNTCRRGAARAALNVIARHGHQFQDHLVSNFKNWFDLLCSWLTIGSEERKLAKQALLGFYFVMALHISEHRHTKEILNFFCNHFKTQLETSKDTDIAVKGFGIFAKAMKEHSPEEIPAIFSILAQRSYEEAPKGNHHKLADYLDSLSVFSAELGVIHNLQLAILEGISVQLICQFALEEHIAWRTVMVDAVICTMLRLSRCNGAALEMYMNTVVHQGIIRSISHPVLEDAEILREAGHKKVVTYENYLPFWQSLITLNKSSKGMICGDANFQETRDLSRKMISRILHCVLDIINRLDLSLKDNVSGEPIFLCNVEKCVEATNPQDFTVLVNLVNFTNDLLNSLPDQSHLTAWISPLIQQNIKLSTRHPLVSSFYKLLANTVLIAQKLGYFEDQKDAMKDAEWRPTVNLLSGFLYDVISRQTQYRDDLQVACLRLMLSTPSCIAAPLLRVCITAFQTVFRLGCSMLSLAHEGLQTLSRWNKEIPKEKMTDLLRNVLPLFDNLLRTQDNVADEEQDSNLNGIAMVKKVLQDQKKKRLWKQEANLHIDTELVQLQKEVVLFLSTLDSTSCLSLLDGGEDEMGVTAWQEDKLLMFPLPFPDMKVEISLDDMLPRLSDLALKCGDRQTRSAACEFLHATIMFMLGKEKQLEIAHQGHLNSLWKHIFPTILTLACDVDLMVSQLFMPLGGELAHWYSSRDQEGSEQTSTFLSALLDGVTHQTDAALRDYSASCLHEYTEWSRKQGHMKNKVEPIIKFIIGLCHHPCSQKRMGAALAFNSMYTVLRENDSIVNQFWLELLSGLVTGLSMCSVTGEDSQTEVQLKKSIQHVLRVLMECSSSFNKDHEQRRIPREFLGGRLYHILRWLLKHCTSLNGTCRHTCMDMVDRLSSYVTDCRCTRDLILQIVASEGNDSLNRIAEGDTALSPTLSKFAWNEAFTWVYSLLSSMESYIWLLEVKTPPEVLFNLPNSKLSQALSYFLGNVVQYTVDETSLWRPKEMENFNFAKCCTIVRLLDYLTIGLENGLGTSLKAFWSSSFWQILLYCCVWPSHIGFDSTSRKVEENLPETVEKFLKSLTCHVSEDIFSSFKDLMKSYISSVSPVLLNTFPKSIQSDKVLPKDKDLLSGLKIIHSVFKEAQSWSGLGGETSLKMVFDSIVEPVMHGQHAPVTLSPLASKQARLMLELYFASSPEIKPLVMMTLNSTKLYQREMQGDLTHGEHFVACFEATIVQRLLKEPRKFIEVLEQLISPSISSQQLSIVTSVLKSSFSHSPHARSLLQKFVSCLFAKWNRFVEWTEGDEGKEIFLISLLVQIVNLDIDFQSNSMRYDSVCHWMIMLLESSSKSLPLKTDLLRCISIVCIHCEDSAVKKCLMNFKNQHFPAKSSEFRAGTEEHTNFVSAFRALLYSLVMTGSSTILLLVVKIMSVDSSHACRHLLPSTLRNFMKQIQFTEGHQVKALNEVYKMFDNETVHTEVRERILYDFLLKLIQYSSEQSQITFSKSVIKVLIEIVSKRQTFELADSRAKQKLLSQIGSWNILQLIYGISQKSLFEERGSELVLAAFQGTETEVKTGKELTTRLTRQAVQAFQNSPSFESMSSDTREMYRQFFCAVYNMFATLLCNMKTDPSDAKFYDKFLFDESSRKIWRLLVDDSMHYMLPYCHTEHLQNVEKVLCIRRKLSENRQQTEKSDFHQTLNLLESQSLSGTLENDITRFDFTHSKVRNVPEDQHGSGEVSSIVLENDALNNHECMATVCSVIRHLVDAGISPLPLTGTAPVMPGWMNSLKRSLIDESSPRNSRIFILRVILNTEACFSPYAVHWIQPLLESTVKICLQKNISYLLGDLLCLLVKWNSETSVINIDQSNVNRLFQHLVENCADNRRLVFKYHLELIKSTLEAWKEQINPPHTSLLNMLENPQKRVGINLTAIMLIYDLTPWTAESKKNFLLFLKNNLQDHVKEIFKASAETLGLCLKHLSEKMDGQICLEDQMFVEQLEMDLKNMHLKQKDCDRFLTVLACIQNNYPVILDSFVSAVLLYLDQMKDFQKAQCLGLLAERLEVLGENPYKELKGRGLLKMISDRNSEVQLKALQITAKLAPSLPDFDLYEAIHEVSLVISFVKGQARHHLYDIALIAFDRYSIKEDFNSLADIEKKVYDESKALLLFGLVDSNTELQRRSYSKWTEEGRLPHIISSRLISAFSSLYSPLTEQYFLSYSVPLLLHGTASTPDFQAVVFQHALDKCDYADRPLIVSWRAQHAQMAPMFAQTISSQMSQTSSLSSTLDSSFQLLATQNSLMFEPTADFVDGSQQSKDQIKAVRSITQSSFLFSQDGVYSKSQNSSVSTKGNYKQGLGFGSERLRFVEEDKLEGETQHQRSNFRLNRYLGKETAVKIFSMANIRRAQRRNEMKRERARRREGQISLYRNYRKGELPDIQIKYADFIKPLIELSKRDTVIARKVMVNIFLGVTAVLQKAGNHYDFRNQTITVMNGILNLSTINEPSTIGTCLEIAYHCQLHLNSDYVFKAAQGSNLLATGVLLLETFANENDPADKKDNDQTFNRRNVWFHLADLYDSLGERDVARATLLHNIALGQMSKNALEAHSEERWADAKKLYIEALGEEETDHDKFFESCFECMSVLSEWTHINSLIREEVDHELDKLWEDTWYERKLLPRLLHCEILSLAQGGRDTGKFINDLNSWLLHEIKGPALKRKFSDVLSIMCLLKKNFAQLRFYGSQALTQFIDGWRELSPLFRKRREVLLMEICNIAELMVIFSEGKDLQSVDDCSELLKLFDKVLPATQDSLMQWETRISYRTACLNQMPDEIQTEVYTSSMKMQLKLVEVALQQGNQNFAKKYLTDIKKKDKKKFDSCSPFIKTRWFLAKCSERYQWATKLTDPVTRLVSLLQIWKDLEQIVVSHDLDENPELSIAAHGAESNLSLSIRHLFTIEPSCLLTIHESASQEFSDWLCSKLQKQITNSSEEFVSELGNIGLTSLLHSKRVSKDCHSESNNFGKQTAEAYLQIAQYCRKILEEKRELSSTDEVTFNKHLVRSILSAMKLGSSQARQLFPLLLQLPALSSDLSKDFKEKSAAVPAWMFLSWIPQILALLDSPAVDVISPVLLKIADKYPNAVSYPYNISIQNARKDNSSSGKVLMKLDSLLQGNQLQIRLIKALSSLTNPHIILRDFCEVFSTAIKSSVVNWASAQKIFDQAFEEILKGTSEPASNFCMFGKIFNVIRDRNISEVLHELNAAIQSKSRSKAQDLLRKIQEKIDSVKKADMKNIKRHSKLKDFSPWLAGFLSSKMNVNIEIPGQYSGDQRPTPERHTMISRFGDTVQVMPSLRKPVKLTIIGSDARNYNFLVKYGEDLRQDERIQQLLRLMNMVFSLNHRCRERQVCVFTYKVIPLSCRLGFIEWVDNTTSLKELMLSPLSPDDKQRVPESTVAEHVKWINQHGRGENISKSFGNVHMRVNQQEASDQFSKLVSMVKSDILRKGLESWSSSAEAFYWLRHSFVTSYSTLCIAHWVLGVGDRHLNNCLVSRSSGKCIGIDFGHCFGTATQFLPVPELIPFRLTPHIVNVVCPYSTSGLIEETMVNALRALKNDSEILLATMQVFILEPSVDWLTFARKHFNESEDKSTWLPTMKIKQVHRKLQGENPVVIIKEDLQTKSTYKKGFLLTARGDPRHNIRARLPEEGLTPRQQVECLIDIATDPNVLVKTYSGWEPWM